MPTCFRRRFGPSSSSAISHSPNDSLPLATQHRACGAVASHRHERGLTEAAGVEHEAIGPLRGGSGRLAGVRERVPERAYARLGRDDASSRSAFRTPRNPCARPATCCTSLEIRGGPRGDRDPPLGGGAPDGMTDIDAAIDRLLLAAAALDLPAPLNPAGEAELEALRAAVGAAPPAGRPRAPVAATPGQPPPDDDRPARPDAGLTGHRVPRQPGTGRRRSSRWPTSRSGLAVIELDAPNGTGGGSVWEGDVGDFDLHEVAPSLADLIDAVATAMEIGIARPRDIGGFRILDWDEPGLKSIENRWCAIGEPSASMSPGGRRAGSRSRGWIPARRSRGVPAPPSPPSASSATAGRTRRRSAERSGAVRVRRGQRRPAGRRHWPAVRLRSAGRRPVPALPERHAPRGWTCVRSMTAWTSGRRSIGRRSRRS